MLECLRSARWKVDVESVGQWSPKCEDLRVRLPSPDQLTWVEESEHLIIAGIHDSRKVSKKILNLKLNGFY